MPRWEDQWVLCGRIWIRGKTWHLPSLPQVSSVIRGTLRRGDLCHGSFTEQAISLIRPSCHVCWLMPCMHSFSIFQPKLKCCSQDRYLLFLSLLAAMPCILWSKNEVTTVAILNDTWKTCHFLPPFKSPLFKWFCVGHWSIPLKSKQELILTRPKSWTTRNANLRLSM